MATYIKLPDYKDNDSKEQCFFNSENRYEAHINISKARIKSI